jgi:hypothetical protein
MVNIVIIWKVMRFYLCHIPDLILKLYMRVYKFPVCLMVINATFNNISFISWRSVLLVEETRGPGENHRPVVTDKIYHIMLYILPWSKFELATSVVISTDCIGSCKSKYHTIQDGPYIPSLSNICNPICAM